MIEANINKNVVVAVDADNTLWDTNSIYANAQLYLLNILENETNKLAKGNKLKFIRSVDQELARLHDYDLKYPPHILIKATINALNGLSPAESAHLALHDSIILNENHNNYLRIFIDHIKHEIPKLRKGVRKGLAQLHKSNCLIIVVTEGSYNRCFSILEQHKLTKYVDNVYEVKKSSDAYKDLSDRLPNIRTKVMIGDQLDRDIIPAKHADYFTIYFPGGFNPSWISEEQSKCFDQQISSFSQVPEIVNRFADFIEDRLQNQR